MPIAAYATAEQLTAWLPDGVTVDDGGRLLARASGVLDDHVRAPFDVHTDTDLPTDDDIATAMADACCAQVEFWLEVGEEHDINGLAGSRVSVGQLSLERLPPVLAPRAARILGNAGLRPLGVATSTSRLLEDVR